MSSSQIKDISLSLPPSLSLASKSAIVTGSSRGIGTAIALTLASRGANIAITYTSSSSTAKAQEMAVQIRSLGRKVCIIQCDLEDENCGDIIVKKALEGLGVKEIDILVNNAALGIMGAVEDGFKPEEFDRLFRVNVRAPALLVKALLPHFSPAKNRIINISSISGRLNLPAYQLYAASKAALDSLTRTWARELAEKHHCTVNGVLVGPTATPDAPDSPARARAKDMATAEKRLGSMDDVAEVVAWLASDSSRWTNGDTIGSNGGIVIE